MVTLAIDPAYSKDFAYAIFRSDKLLVTGKDKYLSTIVNILIKWRPDIVVTEQMYLGPNPATTIKLSESVGKIEGICEIYAVPFRKIPPKDWTLHHGLKGIKNRDMRKLLEDKIIETVIGLVPRDPDIRSAILIGMCHIEQARMGVK